MLLLSGGAIAGGLFFSHHGRSHSLRRASQEERTLALLADGLVRSIQCRLRIPGPEDWTAAVAEVCGFDLAHVASVHPESRDARFRRFLLVDPYLASARALPYAQDDDGLSDSSNALLSDHSRVMIVSCSRPGLVLPFDDSAPTRTEFDALWNWVCLSDDDAPPAGWPDSWSKHGRHLHVARVDLANLFARVSFKHVKFGAASASWTSGAVSASRLALEETVSFLLRGSTIAVANTNGLLAQLRVVRRDEGFDLTPPRSDDDDDGKGHGKGKGKDREEDSPDDHDKGYGNDDKDRDPDEDSDDDARGKDKDKNREEDSPDDHDKGYGNDDKDRDPDEDSDDDGRGKDKDKNREEDSPDDHDKGYGNDDKDRDPDEDSDDDGRGKDKDKNREEDSPDDHDKGYGNDDEDRDSDEDSDDDARGKGKETPRGKKGGS